VGRFVDRFGRAARGPREIWQCDALGSTTTWASPKGDPDFQGFGKVRPMPRAATLPHHHAVPYPGRTPHIHFTVVEGGKRRLTSQMFIEGEPATSATASTATSAATRSSSR
jgi:protocatechuate 3,4-dioxygenase beta subunit